MNSRDKLSAYGPDARFDQMFDNDNDNRQSWSVRTSRNVYIPSLDKEDLYHSGLLA